MYSLQDIKDLEPWELKRLYSLARQYQLEERVVLLHDMRIAMHASDQYDELISDLKRKVSHYQRDLTPEQIQMESLEELRSIGGA